MSQTFEQTQPGVMIGLFRELVRRRLREAIEPVIEQAIEEAMEQFEPHVRMVYSDFAKKGLVELTVKTRREPAE